MKSIRPLEPGIPHMKQNSTLSLTMQAYNKLKGKIVRLQLRPGELLLVQPLAKELGISRTPVREAMIRLEREGFVEEAEGKKFKVTEITLKSILEIHEIRELIELHTVAKAAVHRSQEQMDRLQELAASMERALNKSDHVAFFQTDMDFHSQIIHIGNNKTLESLMHQLNEKIQRIRHLTTYVHKRIEDTVGEHAAILSAIGNQDAEAAQKTMKNHLGNVKQGVIHLFQNGAMNYFGGVNL